METQKDHIHTLISCRPCQSLVDYANTEKRKRKEQHALSDGQHDFVAAGFRRGKRPASPVKEIPMEQCFFFSCRRRNIAHTELFIHVSSRPFHSQRMYTDRQNNNTNFPCESCRDTPPRGYDSWSAQTADDQPSSFAPKTFSRSCYGAVSTDQLPRNLHAKTLTSKVQQFATFSQRQVAACLLAKKGQD